jgi:hypothetical protein
MWQEMCHLATVVAGQDTLVAAIGWAAMWQGMGRSLPRLLSDY